MKAALVGLGRMGQRHLQNLTEAGYMVVGVADPFPDAREGVTKAFDLDPKIVFDDPLQMIAETSSDLIVVASTAPSHCEVACAAANAGVHYILCEKPMAVSLDECDQMIAACKDTGSRLAINHQMRFMDQYIEPKKLIEGGSIGRLGSVNVVAGNFGLAMNGTHYFEMFRYITDEKPKTVQAWFSPEVVKNPRGEQFLDHAGCIRIETDSQKRFYLDCSSDHGHGMHVIYSGNMGRIDIDELVGSMYVASREDEHRKEPTTRYAMPFTETKSQIPPADAVTPSLSVMKALVEGGDYPSGEIGRMALETLVAAYLSHENGNCIIDLSKDTLPRSRVFPWA